MTQHNKLPDLGSNSDEKDSSRDWLLVKDEFEAASEEQAVEDLLCEMIRSAGEQLDFQIFLVKMRTMLMWCKERNKDAMLQKVLTQSLIHTVTEDPVRAKKLRGVFNEALGKEKSRKRKSRHSAKNKFEPKTPSSMNGYLEGGKVNSHALGPVRS